MKYGKKAHFYEKWQEFYICQIRKYEVLDDIWCLLSDTDLTRYKIPAIIRRNIFFIYLMKDSSFFEIGSSMTTTSLFW